MMHGGTRLVVWLGLLTVAVYSAHGQSKPTLRHRPRLIVGWHDEMNDPKLWKPLGRENVPDIYAARPGVLTLRLPHVPEGYPYQYQWSGVARSISADLGRYPVLVAHVSSLENGAYAHLDIERRDFQGRVTRSSRSPTLVHPGLTAVDLGKDIGPAVHRLTVRLIVGGKLDGAKCDYNWIRFIRREDLAWLREAPDVPVVDSGEPLGGTPRPAQPGSIPSLTSRSAPAD